MTTKVFLSLSYIDAGFVREVRDRLPHGVAYFYEESFNTGELLLSAMERAVRDSAIFVLFASKAGLTSPWVQYEIAEARVKNLTSANHKVLVFPTDADVSASDLPQWLRSFWVARAGWSPADIARYVTGVLLEPNGGFASSAVQILGRGKSLDKLNQIAADHIGRTYRSPNVYFLSGVRGVGRRTFASFYMRTSLAPDANLSYGPTLQLPGHADLADLHRSLRTEISPTIGKEQALKEREAFGQMSEDDQVDEVVRLMGHFQRLGQAITIVSAGGFFEDRGDLKQWVIPFLSRVPASMILFIVSNRQIPLEDVERLENVVQMRLDGLDDKDLRALMIMAANRLQIERFEISDALVHAIGGHPDVANAAVRLVSVKGLHILERDPRQLFNIQSTILGENIQADALTDIQRQVLSLLSWVPSLNSAVLEGILVKNGITIEEMFDAIESLRLGCLVTAEGPDYAISAPIRHLYRRFNVTPPELLKQLSDALSALWEEADAKGQIRTDLFETFIYIHSLEGAALPKELKALLTPGMLADVLREMYSKAKDDNSSELLGRVVSWARLADGINMSPSTREEVMSVLARAQIRSGAFRDAAATIEDMAERKFRSVPFLRGHMFRKQRKFPEAIEMLRQAVSDKKVNRSAIHELALCYKKSGQTNDLRNLLADHGHLARDSAIFQDFQIGVDLARGDQKAVEAGIRNLQGMPDDDGRSTIRNAQLLMKWQEFKQAKNQLTKLLNSTDKNSVRARSVRAMAAARDGDFELARKDIEFIAQLPGWKDASLRLQASLLVEQKMPSAAREILDALSMGPEDRLLYARALEVEADLPSTPLHASKEFRERAAEIRAANNFALEYDLVD